LLFAGIGDFVFLVLKAVYFGIFIRMLLILGHYYAAFLLWLILCCSILFFDDSGIFFYLCGFGMLLFGYGGAGFLWW
jgi:hypothetical protein